MERYCFINETDDNYETPRRIFLSGVFVLGKVYQLLEKYLLAIIDIGRPIQKRINNILSINWKEMVKGNFAVLLKGTTTKFIIAQTNKP